MNFKFSAPPLKEGSPTNSALRMGLLEAVWCSVFVFGQPFFQPLGVALLVEHVAAEAVKACVTSVENCLRVVEILGAVNTGSLRVSNMKELHHLFSFILLHLEVIIVFAELIFFFVSWLESGVV